MVQGAFGFCGVGVLHSFDIAEQQRLLVDAEMQQVITNTRTAYFSSYCIKKGSNNLNDFQVG